MTKLLEVTSQLYYSETASAILPCRNSGGHCVKMAKPSPTFFHRLPIVLAFFRLKAVIVTDLRRGNADLCANFSSGTEVRDYNRNSRVFYPTTWCLMTSSDL